jgi:hypothetical protein
MPNMTQSCLAATVFRRSVAALLIFLAFASSAAAQRVRREASPADAPGSKVASISGVYEGTYTAGDQGPTKFKMTLTQQENGVLAGTFTLYVPEGADTKEYTCDVRGIYISANGMVQIARIRWEATPPAGIDMPGMTGQFDPAGGKGAGQISGKTRSRTAAQFDAIRDADESAKMVGAHANNKGPVPAARAAAPRGNEPIGRKAGAPQPSGAAPVIDPHSAAAINGVYAGGYQVGDGTVLKAKLALKARDDGSLTGLFTFNLPESAGVASATYKLTGKYVAGNRYPFQFTTVEPEGKPAPDGYQFKTLSAGFEPGGLVQGKNGIEYGLNMDRISGPVGERGGAAFSAERDKAASADLDKAMAELASAAAHPGPAAAEARPAIEGVYTGSYTDKQGTTTLKLTLWMTKENRTVSGKVASTDLAGVLTLNVPKGSETTSYTCALAGMINPQRNLQLTVKRWEARPPSNIGGLSGKFEPDGGGQGVAKLSGYISDASNSKFDARRDAAESAKMDIAALTSNVRPGVPGVFNGTYTGENQPPKKFKLTITHNGDGPRGLAGMATIYLPGDSGEKAYTYSLTGALDGYDHFHLSVNDWETAPPNDFKDFKGMGFNGTIVLNLSDNTATIVSAPAASPLASAYVPQFKATWDAAESAHIQQTIAAQKSVGADEQAAALKAHEEMIKKAQPKELASKDLVRKSRQYWGGFQNDMIREVFDGGFGVGIDENREFQKTFCTYVEMFAAKCPECLPPDHQKVTILFRTNRRFDRSGNLISEENHDFTVDMDSRFVDAYKRCWSALTSKGAVFGDIVAAQQAGGVQHILHEMVGLATDMQRFFADHGGKSAAMRQLTENFVRAINDKPSLQQSGEKIDGAEAESDKDVLPGRYARLVDGGNAYFQERAKKDPLRYGDRLAHDTAVCQRLAELYQFGMSADEQYYYANDFAGRFLPIMGPRSGCADPAWPRLHPAVERAVAEVK